MVKIWKAFIDDSFCFLFRFFFYETGETPKEGEKTKKGGEEEERKAYEKLSQTSNQATRKKQEESGLCLRTIHLF